MTSMATRRTSGPGEPDGPAGGPPTGPSRRASRGRQTRRRLLDAAEEVFAELSFHDASIVRIVERAGVAQGTFYIYFRSKQQIFEELVSDLNVRLRKAMSTAASGGGSRYEAERRGFAAFFRFTAEHPALYRVIREAEFVAPDAMHRHYEKIVEGYVRALEPAMETGEVAPSDPVVLAWALIAVGQLVGMRWIVWDQRGEIPDEVFEQCMLVVRRMLGQMDGEAPPALADDPPGAHEPDPGSRPQPDLRPEPGQAAPQAP
jgi:AcrR family transcriptional regulator